MLYKFWTNEFVRQGTSNVYKGKSFYVEAPTVEEAYKKIESLVGANYRVMNWVEWNTDWGKPDAIIT